MKIAVPYEDGNIFPHLGKAETFKMYQVNEDSILSSELVTLTSLGHEGVIALLKDADVHLLICGGIGNMARFELSQTAIQLMPGATGQADQAVLSFLNGNLHFDNSGGCGGCGGHGGEDGEPFIGACGHSCF